MSKRDSKINSKKANLDRLELIKTLRNDFPIYVPYTNRNKKIIKYANEIDWHKALFLFERMIDDLLHKIDVPEDSAGIIEMIRDTFFLFLKRQYYSLLILGWNEQKNKKDSFAQWRMINDIQDYAELEIKGIVEVIKLSMDYSNIKPIKFYEKLTLKNIEIQRELKKFSRFRQHDFDEENLNFYEKVYMRIDENIDSDIDINYKDIVRRLTREDFKSASEKTIKKNYHSFMAFKNRHKIYNYQQFKEFLITLASK